MLEGLLDFLRGATLIASLGVAVFFLRFWNESKDRLFLFFSAAFFLMAVSQPFGSFSGRSGDYNAYCYWIRLVAFLLIIIGIITKNTEKSSK